jgi:hypothetical protein
MGSPTVVIIDQVGNKFILGAEDDVFVAKQPVTAEAILGKESILGLTGFRYICHIYTYIYIYAVLLEQW